MKLLYILGLVSVGTVAVGLGESMRLAVYLALQEAYLLTIIQVRPQRF